MTRIMSLVAAALLVLVCSLHAREQQSSAPAPQARTDAGLVEGVLDGATGITTFRGIPYAAPPTGEWRWQPPRPVAPWTGVRQASHYGAVCPQGTNASSEDCLFLNVWTPAMGASTPAPVIVIIHGGGAAVGSGAGPDEHLAAKGVVVVTMNYRLGLLGHLAHRALREPGHTGSGNYALLDQIAALAWVQRNISAFGGDPSRVTAAGTSAGAKAVATLLVSPLATGLFQRAILQSGSGLDDSVEPLADAETGVRRWPRGSASATQMQMQPAGCAQCRSATSWRCRQRYGRRCWPPGRLPPARGARLSMDGQSRSLST